MSVSEVERFAQDLKSNPALLADAKAVSLDSVMALASRHGYDFTLDEARDFMRANAERAGRRLSASQLDRVAGGSFGCIAAGLDPGPDGAP
jgi:predicted ribosomally synthesized peptide with nif11-like leader